MFRFRKVTMKTMAVVHHRNHYYGQTKPRIAGRFGSHHPRGFAGVNCRNFEASAPRLRSGRGNSGKQSKPIAISTKPSKKGPSFDEGLPCSELFAGPIYLNSPPPSSVPIPKFSLPQKRGVRVSLELPLPLSGIELEPGDKSAPSSPSGDDVSTATENLRRILHLDGC